MIRRFMYATLAVATVTTGVALAAPANATTTPDRTVTTLTVNGHASDFTIHLQDGQAPKRTFTLGAGVTVKGTGNPVPSGKGKVTFTRDGVAIGTVGLDQGTAEAADKYEACTVTFGAKFVSSNLSKYKNSTAATVTVEFIGGYKHCNAPAPTPEPTNTSTPTDTGTPIPTVTVTTPGPTVTTPGPVQTVTPPARVITVSAPVTVNPSFTG